MRPLRQATGVTGGQQPAAVAQHPGVRVTEVGGERLSTGAALDAGDADDDLAVAVQAHLLVAVAELGRVRLPAPDPVEVLRQARYPARGIHPGKRQRRS